MEKTGKFLNLIWEVMLARGILLVALGIFILVWPVATLAVAATILAIYLLVTGVVGFVAGLSAKGHPDVFEIITGALGIILGVLKLKYPGVSLLTFIYIIGLWFIIRGISDIVTKKVGESKALSIFAGALAIILGLMLLNKPIATGAALYWSVGLYSLIAGPIWIVTAMSIRSKLSEEGH